ncbi:xylulokinase [Staphylococcus warneri]|uniref:xylulokinase n=1 Tax=Staphylococcus warneri TaxID=1292 RepID=UPI0021A9631E|nr:xylulokinase [Staphylococcus warneri]MCT2595940.1 xylulokinase [Staphylococcus warneri]
MKEVVLGIDLGTSSIKVIAVNQQGDVIESENAPLSLIQEQSGYSEQDPEAWFQATKKAILALMSSSKMEGYVVKGMSFSGQMHGLVIVDKEGHVLRNAILWNDTRNSEQCRQIIDKFGHRVNENPVLEGFTLPKMLWVQQQEPEIWKNVDYFMLPKDYLRFRLTGNIHMEYSDAASTLLLSPKTNQWTKDLGDTFEIGDIYPPLVDSHAFTGNVLPTIAEELGLNEDVATFAGGGDNACGAIGAGVIHDKETLCSIGTSGVILNVEHQSVTEYDNNLHFFNHAIPQTYYAMGVTLAAGYSFNWLKHTFFEEESFDQLIQLASQSTIGANGLLFAPYLAGERTPHGDATIRGSFIGISGQHTKADFVRAVIEGIMYSLYDSIQLIRQAGNEINTVISIGGGAKSDFWLQLQADVFNTSVKKLKHEEGPSMGAAIIAAYGLGWYQTFEECVNDFIQVENVFKPNTDKHQQYEYYHNIYKDMYKHTKDMTAKLIK